MAKDRRLKGTGTIFKRNGKFVHQYSDIDGKVKTITLKDECGKPVTLRAKADAIVAELTRERQKIEFIENRLEYMAQVAGSRKIIQRSRVKLSELWEMYLRNPNRPDSGKLTLKRNELYCRKFLSFLAEKKIDSIDDITFDTAATFMTNLWSTGISPKTYNYYLQTLKLVFKTLLQDDSPFRNIKAKTATTESRKPFTPEQVSAIFKTLDDDNYHILHKPQMRILFLLGLCFGLRMHDAACFRWDYIQGDGTVKFKARKTIKTMKQYIVLPIPSILEEQFKIAETWKRNEYILPDVAERYGYNSSGISTDVDKLLRSAGIQTKEQPVETRRMFYINSQGETKQRRIGRYSFHSFRHTFCTIAASSGKDLSLIRSIVGHSNVAMTEHYTHYTLEAKKSVIESIPLAVMTNSPRISAEIPLITAFQQADTEALAKVINYLESNLSDKQKREILELLVESF